MRLTRRVRNVALGTGFVVLLAGAAAAPASSRDEAGPLSFTVYEISDRVIITDETPRALTLVPGQPPQQEELTNPVPNAAGVGDELIIDSTLYRNVNTIQVPTLPPFLPIAAVRDEIPVPWESFVPAGPPIGEALGVCTFVTVDIELPPGPPNTAPLPVDEREASCDLTFQLPQGDIVAGGILDVTALEAGEPAKLAIVGGTDLFKRARGTVTLQQPSEPAFDRFKVTVDYRL